MHPLRSQPGSYRLAALLGALVLVMAACGTGNPTATPVPTATSIPTPTPTEAAGPTATPSATPAPGAAVPTPTVRDGRRGGVLITRSIAQPTTWDTYNASGSSEVHVLAGLFNNLVFADPYGDGTTIVGDVAESWEFAENGRVVLFHLHPGITFHDGTPMTSEDVAYNLERAWQPRSPSMTFFKARFATIEGVDTPDDRTVRVTLSDPSNIFFQAATMSQFLIYPSHLPIPEREDTFKEQPMGTGPFKFKDFVEGTKLELVRNDDYWKEGLPYLDGHEILQLSSEATISAFRTGRLDATNLDTGAVTPVIDDIVQATGFVPIEINLGIMGAVFNQREPWTNPKVLEAIDLAMDREAIVATWLQGRGSPVVPPLMPPEMGGQWGISLEEMSKRPGYRVDQKEEDIARAQALLDEAGIDPSQYTAHIVGHVQIQVGQEAADASFRRLGFQTRLEALGTVELSQRQQNGDFDIYLPSTGNINLDDPMDIQANLFHSEGVWNYGNWFDPEMDRLFAEQDRTLDRAQRQDLLYELQEKMLEVRWHIGLAWRFAIVGHQPWMKNYPENLPFLFSPRYTYEQAWLDR